MLTRVLVPFSLALAACVTASSLVGCGRSGGVPEVAEARSQLVRTLPWASAEQRTLLANGNGQFALKLFHRLNKGEGNLVISPTSVSMALAMTFAGARGETDSQIARAFDFGLPQASLHHAMNWLDQELAARGASAKGAEGEAFHLQITNAVWAQEGLAILPAFLDVQAQHYGAGVKLLNFAGDPEGSRQTINDWVAAKTDDRIRDLLEPSVITRNTRLVLTNAVYLSAAWLHPLNENTVDAPFQRLDGSAVSVPTMSKTAAFGNFENEALQAVELPYEEKNLSMLIVLPRPGKYAEVESSLSWELLASISAGLKEEQVYLRLPRFKFTSPVPLRQTLSELGMPIAFSPAADFSGIASEHLQITDVVHQAFISVGETGTKAAAATSVVIGRKSSSGVAISADRPFLFALRDRPTGAILFLGRVMDPSR